MPNTQPSSSTDQKNSKRNLKSHSSTSTYYQTFSRYSVRQPAGDSSLNQTIESNPTQAYGALPYESYSMQNTKTHYRFLAPVKSQGLLHSGSNQLSRSRLSEM
jgi:hypothetical protein